MLIRQAEKLADRLWMRFAHRLEQSFTTAPSTSLVCRLSGGRVKRG
jgi:hypothetical protein